MISGRQTTDMSTILRLLIGTISLSSQENIFDRLHASIEVLTLKNQKHTQQHIHGNSYISHHFQLQGAHITIMTSNKHSTSSTSAVNSHHHKHMKNKIIQNDADASTLYLDFSNHSTNTKQTAASATSTSSLRSLSSAKNLISLSLQQEKEHTENESANRSSRNLGSVLRHNPSCRKRNLYVPNSSSIGLRLSELTSLSTSSQCDDDEYDEYTDDDVDNESRGSYAAVDDGESSVTSGRTIFHKIANRVKIASSSSTKNLAAIAELSNDLVNEIETQHRSNYLKKRVSIRVRRASDLLFFSHHLKDLEDDAKDDTF